MFDVDVVVVVDEDDDDDNDDAGGLDGMILLLYSGRNIIYLLQCCVCHLFNTNLHLAYSVTTDSINANAYFQLTVK